MKIRITLSAIFLLPLLLGIVSCQESPPEISNGELDQTSWTFTGYIDQGRVFEPLAMPEEWKDKSYQMSFKENKFVATMPVKATEDISALSYGQDYQIFNNGKWTVKNGKLLDGFLANVDYGDLSERFINVLENVYSYELFEDELKLISTESNKASQQKGKIVMVFKKDEL